jgi:hypothetical protein
MALCRKESHALKPPTTYVWIIGRTQTNGKGDYDAVHMIQASYKITLLSAWGREPQPVNATVDQGFGYEDAPSSSG